MPTGNPPNPSPLRKLANSGALRTACMKTQHEIDDWKIIQWLEFKYPGYAGPLYWAVLNLAKAGVEACQESLNAAKDAFEEIPKAPLLPP